LYSANRRQGVGVGSVGSIGSIGEGICGCIDKYLVFRRSRKTAARSHPAAEGCSARESSPASSAGCGLRLFLFFHHCRQYFCYLRCYAPPLPSSPSFTSVRPLLLSHLLTSTLPSFQFFGLSFGLSLFFHLSPPSPLQAPISDAI